MRKSAERLLASLRPISHSFVELIPAIICAFLGGLLFFQLDLPAPWISGSMLGAMMSALIRPMPEMHPRLRDVAFLMTGTSMGAGVTPETVALLGKVPLSFLVLAISIVAIIYFSSLWLTKVHGWTREDAMLAAAPGALSTALAIAAARGGDVLGVAVVQTTRLFILVALLPGLIAWIEGGQGSSLLALTQMSWGTLVLMLVGGAICGYALNKLKITAAAMLGAALFGAFLHGGGYVSGYTPMPIAIGGFVLVGVMIATRTRGLSWKAVFDYAAASAASFIIGGIVAGLCALAASWLINISIGATLLAFAPGGVEAMTLLAMSLAYDPLYVVAHHIARFMSIGLCIPIWFRLTDKELRKS
ncbi:AbrB family transcriptional regulator [Terrarubrum flagellatum]|uniref:AbrB family transcriptional regulator n=1 Tax=Terrirubrum flagellatum TaxID=2895980 RepID=UPI0031451203